MKLLTEWAKRRREKRELFKKAYEYFDDRKETQNDLNVLIKNLVSVVQAHKSVIDKMNAKYSALEGFLMAATKESEAKRKAIEAKLEKEEELEESEYDKKY